MLYKYLGILFNNAKSVPTLQIMSIRNILIFKIYYWLLQTLPEHVKRVVCSVTTVFNSISNSGNIKFSLCGYGNKLESTRQLFGLTGVGVGGYELGKKPRNMY